MEAVAEQKQQNDNSTIVLSVISGVELHINHEALPNFVLMRSTQLQSLTRSLIQLHSNGDCSEGSDWVLEEISSQLHKLLPHAISLSFDVSCDG